MSAIVVRSGRQTVRNLGLSALMALIGFLLLAGGFALGEGAVSAILGIVGFSWIVVLPLFFLWQAAFQSGETPCPGCRKPILGLGKHEAAVLCPSCAAYAEVKNRVVSPVPEDRVYDRPAFCAPLPEKVRWPNGCAVCAGEVTRFEPIGEVAAVREMPPAEMLTILFADGQTTRNAEGKRGALIPHCAEHGEGVRIDRQARAQFRSLKYLRAYCELNGLKPVAA